MRRPRSLRFRLIRRFMVRESKGQKPLNYVYGQHSCQLSTVAHLWLCIQCDGADAVLHQLVCQPLNHGSPQPTPLPGRRHGHIPAHRRYGGRQAVQRYSGTGSTVGASNAVGPDALRWVPSETWVRSVVLGIAALLLFLQNGCFSAGQVQLLLCRSLLEMTPQRRHDQSCRC